MSLRSCLLALVVVVAAAAALPAQDSTFVIRGARVFDGTQLLGEQDVLVRGGRIAALGRRLDVPPGASVVEARGKTLLPGFIDAHTHSGDGKVYRVMLFAQSKGMTPVTRTFQSTAEWKEHTFPLVAFGTDGNDLVMLIVAAGPAPGAFELFVDGVKLK